MVDIYTFSRVSTKNRTKLLQIKEFLCQHQLTVDDDVEHLWWLMAQTKSSLAVELRGTC